MAINKALFDACYAFLSDPNIIFLLFVVAMMGLLLEISHPGAILPGVAGTAALFLFLLGAILFSPDWLGLTLMVLAFILLVLDVKLLTHGVLTACAVIALIVGALIFFHTGHPSGHPQLNPLTVYVMAGVVGLLGLTLVAFIMKAMRNEVRNGVEGMIGAFVIAQTSLVPEGRVSYAGESWVARLDAPDVSADPSTQLQIVAVDGLCLHVRVMRSSVAVETAKL